MSAEAPLLSDSETEMPQQQGSSAPGSGAASPAPPSSGDLASMSPRQMEEMMAMLQRMHSEKGGVGSGSGSIHGGSSSSHSTRPSAKAYELPLHRLPPLPSAFHPIRRFVYANRQLSTVMAFAFAVFAASTIASKSRAVLSSTGYSGSAMMSSPRGGGGKSKVGGVMSDFVISSPFSKKDDLLYYNLPGRDPQNAGSLPYGDYPDGGAVIAFLVTSNHKDVSDIQTALHSLAFLQGDQERGLPLSPVLVFNEDDLSEEQKFAIVTSTNRPVAFPTVDFMSFPEGFHPDDFDRSPQFEVADRKPWGYYQMIRFWVTGIWNHPAIGRFGTVMRMDSDSCFKAPNSYLPHMAHDRIVYHSQYVGVESDAGKTYLNGLYDFSKEYLNRVGKFPGNAMLWNYIETVWSAKGTLPVFRTNLEVSSKAFMLREDVVRWHEALTENEPFGMFRFRWGDAVTRFLEAAIFATDETTLTIKAEGYEHKRGCSWVEVEEALKVNGLL